MTDKIKELRNELKQLREENRSVYNQLEQRNKDTDLLKEDVEGLIERNATLRRENEEACKKIRELRETIKNSVSKDFTLQAIAAAAGNSKF